MNQDLCWFRPAVLQVDQGRVNRLNLFKNLELGFDFLLAALDKKRPLARQPVNPQGHLDQVAQPFPGQAILLGKYFEIEGTQIAAETVFDPVERQAGECGLGRGIEKKPEVETLVPAELDQRFESDLSGQVMDP